jgi:hypothetical protein
METSGDGGGRFAQVLCPLAKVPHIFFPSDSNDGPQWTCDAFLSLFTDTRICHPSSGSHEFGGEMGLGPSTVRILYTILYNFESESRLKIHCLCGISNHLWSANSVAK